MSSSRDFFPMPEDGRNKYELIIIAGKEARRLNEMARQQGREVKGRITLLALKRFLNGDIKYRYEEPAQPVVAPTAALPPVSPLAAS